MLVHAFPQRYVWIRQRARQLVKDHFTWPKVAIHVVQAYHAVLEGRFYAKDRGLRIHQR